MEPIKLIRSFTILLALASVAFSCKKEGCTDPVATNYNADAKKDDGSCIYPEPRLVFVFEFDSTQARLNNFGLPAGLPFGHAGQNPKMNKMSAHYLELAPSAFTALGSGAVVFHAAETTAGGETAIDFSAANAVGNNEEFYSIPLKDVAAGEYEYLRVSLAYQNYDIKFHLDSVYNVPGVGNVSIVQDFNATVASFVGYNTYITNYFIKNQNITVNANKKQGYWGFETSGNIVALGNYPFSYYDTGSAPEGSTTVVNPLSATSPIPAGSCVVTGAFNGGKLKITGNETKDIIVRVSLSTNKSFEWIDGNGNNKFEPTKGEQIVDMGLRGVIPYVQQ
jgi:hypothetical protein